MSELVTFYKVGDPDPASLLEGPCCGKQKQGRLRAMFRCTLLPKHSFPQHIAGDGLIVCAVWPVTA